MSTHNNGANGDGTHYRSTSFRPPVVSAALNMQMAPRSMSSSTAHMSREFVLWTVYFATVLRVFAFGREDRMGRVRAAILLPRRTQARSTVRST